MDKYIVVIDNAPKRETLRCMYYALDGVGQFVELTHNTYLVMADTDITLLRNLFRCALGHKAKVFITGLAGSACWTSNLLTRNDRIVNAITQ